MKRVPVLCLDCGTPTTTAPRDSRGVRCEDCLAKRGPERKPRRKEPPPKSSKQSFWIA